MIALTHPDRGGNHDICIWAQAMREHVCKDVAAPHTPPPRPEPRTVYEDGRVPFPADSIFGVLTTTAIEQAGAVDTLCGRLLLLLGDCYSTAHLPYEEQRGTSYKRLAYIAHLAGMTKPERVGWYRVAEDIPLSDRHVGHIIKRLKEGA